MSNNVRDILKLPRLKCKSFISALIPQQISCPTNEYDDDNDTFVDVSCEYSFIAILEILSKGLVINSLFHSFTVQLLSDGPLNRTGEISDSFLGVRHASEPRTSDHTTAGYISQTTDWIGSEAAITGGQLLYPR